ncbi:MAG: histidine phosphatase family protein, partial [Segetibacter sp.]
MTTLLLIRHAITDSVGKSLAGRKKAIPLNDHGRQQAQKLAQHISHLPIHAIYASPLERTTETANYIAEKIHQEVFLSEDFLEINFGDWTDNTFDNLA